MYTHPSSCRSLSRRAPWPLAEHGCRGHSPGHGAQQLRRVRGARRVGKVVKISLVQMCPVIFLIFFSSVMLVAALVEFVEAQQ